MVMTMSPQDRRRLQLAQLGIAEAIADLCDRHGISFFLLGGSALGARRHAGFIPWDDDLDMAMLRPHYERFLRIAQHELPNSLYVQDWLRDPHMGVPFTKVRLNHTRLIEQSSQSTGGHKGIAVDVFPLDNAPDGNMQYQQLRFEVMFWRRVLRYQLNYNVRPLKGLLGIADVMVRAASRLCSIGATKRRLHKIMTRFCDVATSRVTVMGSSYSFPKHTLNREWATILEPRQFEERKFPCCGALDEYLGRLYGDFMALPPMEERGIKHTIVELKFDPSGQTAGLNAGPAQS